jgi:anthranilate synthase component 2
MKVLVIDNYDSFTYNLVHIIEQYHGVEITVIRNDKFKLEELSDYDKILLSPGPGIPSEAGLLLDVIKYYAPLKPMLGVCLGHQAIAEAFGGKLVNLDTVMHGIAMNTIVTKKEDALFRDISSPFLSGRYHSWAVDANTIPDCIEVTAIDDNGLVMALSHKEYNLKGMQFHPESILTEQGKEILFNWLAE